MATKRLAKNLKLLRVAAGLTIRQLADRAKLDKDAITNLEQGHVKNPKIETILALAKALDCEITDLL